MFANLMILNKELHAGRSVVPVSSYAYAANVHVASVAIHEFSKAAALYPLVFIQPAAGEQFSPVALLGLNEGRNLFVNEAGQWTVSYVPASIRKYPFALVPKDSEGAEFVVCVDESSGCLSADQGQPLFNSQGEPAPVLEGAIKFLSELQKMDQQTHHFCQLLKEFGLLVPLNVELRSAKGARKVAGAFVVDEVALNNLTSEQAGVLQRHNYLPVVYAHLLSMGQFERLVSLADASMPTEQKGEELQSNPGSPESSPSPTKAAPPAKKSRKRAR